MKNTWLGILIVFLCISIPQAAFAGELKNLGKKAAGWTAGFLLGATNHYHVGHRVLLVATDTENEWHGFNSFSYRQENDSKRALVAAGGFMAQVVSTEIILGTDRIPKDNSVVQGWLLWNIVHPFAYTIAREFKIGNFGDGYGDLEALDGSGVKAEYVEVALIAHAIWSAYRLHEDPNFQTSLRITKRELGILFTFDF